MAKTTITDPDVYRPDAPVDARGRVSIGTAFAGERVEIVAKVVGDE